MGSGPSHQTRKTGTCVFYFQNRANVLGDTKGERTEESRKAFRIHFSRVLADTKGKNKKKQKNTPAASFLFIRSSVNITGHKAGHKARALRRYVLVVFFVLFFARVLPDGLGDTRREIAKSAEQASADTRRRGVIG